MQQPCKATYIKFVDMLFLTCLLGFFIQITINNYSYIILQLYYIILNFSNKSSWVGSVFIYLKTHFAGNVLIDPILIAYIIDNTIRNRLNDVRQIPGNGSYLVFAPMASILIFTNSSIVVYYTSISYILFLFLFLFFVYLVQTSSTYK